MNEQTRACLAAEELSTLGYAKQSELLWRSALVDMAADPRLDPARAESIGQLLADVPLTRGAWIAWQDRARALATAPPPRAARAGLVVALALFAVASISFVARLARPVVASSGDYGPNHAAALAFDGDPSSEWLLPDHSPGYLDVAFPRPCTVHRVLLTNGHNAPYHDRALKRARVVVLDDDLEVDSAEISFTTADAARQSVALAAKRGTRVRIYVLEYFGVGGALAEVEIE